MPKTIPNILLDAGISGGTTDIKSKISALPRDELIELALWCASRYQNKMQRGEVRGIERASMRSVKEFTPKIGAALFHTPNEFNSKDWEEFKKLPEAHPAMVAYREEQEEGYLRKKELKEWRESTSFKLGDAIREFTEQLRAEWTSELLDQLIAMPDGTTTTWGHATIDQHRERLAMFQANAIANIEGAARHQQAIEDLESAGVSTLAELQPVAA